MNYISMLLLVLLNLSCSPQDSVSAPLSVKIELLKEYVVKDSVVDCCGGRKEYFDNKNYDIQISIENNTDSIVSPALMTCSWNENIIINVPSIHYVTEDCNSNYPHFVKIKPHDKYTLTTTLAKYRYSYNAPVNLKMGLIFISQFADYHKIMDDKSSWQILWSNPVELH